MSTYHGLCVRNLTQYEELEEVARFYHEALAKSGALEEMLCAFPRDEDGAGGRKALCLVLGPNHGIDPYNLSGWFWVIPIANKPMAIPWHWYRLLQDKEKEVLAVVFITNVTLGTLRAPAIHTPSTQRVLSK